MNKDLLDSKELLKPKTLNFWRNSAFGRSFYPEKIIVNFLILLSIQGALVFLDAQLTSKEMIISIILIHVCSVFNNMLDIRNGIK